MREVMLCRWRIESIDVGAGFCSELLKSLGLKMETNALNSQKLKKLKKNRNKD